ncbi:hypothetical protein [Rhizobium giardinii]|uniref:Uncharacterized protein n=1 Tax=Rhizobium giardinii TaxID=56731 RepID=A0A7W8UAS7_9HYPH|nr:hypothetical protein [Rhizobium giardinii]MBB5535903.1 hypothetical protein [Rhizobium giardinii]
MVSDALGKDDDKDDDVNHGSAASSRVLSRSRFMNVSETGAAIAGADGAFRAFAPAPRGCASGNCRELQIRREADCRKATVTAAGCFLTIAQMNKPNSTIGTSSDGVLPAKATAEADKLMAAAVVVSGEVASAAFACMLKCRRTNSS